jgi:hypothetical protein
MTRAPLACRRVTTAPLKAGLGNRRRGGAPLAPRLAALRTAAAHTWRSRLRSRPTACRRRRRMPVSTLPSAPVRVIVFPRQATHARVSTRAIVLPSSVKWPPPATPSLHR